MVRILRVKRLMLQDFSWLFPKWRWHSFRSQMLLHVAMITWLSIWRLFDRPDTSPRRICRIDAMFRIFARILTSVCAVLIRRPGGSVHVIRCSHLFCEDLDFRLGRPDSSPWRIFPCDVIFRLFLRRYLLPIGSFGLQGSVERPISKNDRPFLIITYVTRWSKFNVHYALCRACKM